MYFIIFILFLNIVWNVESTSNVCLIDNKESCDDSRKSHKYIEDLDEKYKEIFRMIKNAQHEYIPCDVRNCGCYTNVIEQDLKAFTTNGIDREMIEMSKPRGTLYQIINGQLYRDAECMFPSRCAGIEHFILKVAKNLSQDIEFVINTRDYPQSGIYFGNALPIFSFSKTQEYFDIMYPAWSFWEGGPAISLYPRGLGRWDQHRKTLNKSSNENSWDNKDSKGFFRGSRTSPERDNLVFLSRKNPDLVDAQYTKNQAWKSEADTLNAPPAPEISLEDHCKYKYLFNYRGVAASFRHKHLFLCRSLVFHVGDEWREFYYNAMKPWIHYIPVDKEATQEQLAHLLKFAKENDHVSRTIAEHGRDFVWKNLRMQDVTCYWTRLLKEYSKLLRYRPDLRPGVVAIGKE